MKECVINEFLSVKGETKQWDIYIAEKKIDRNDYDLYDIPPDIILRLDEYNSADDFFLGWKYKETDFESACKILRVWHENNYNTNLIVKDGAFPLLRELYIAGDPTAIAVFKSEIKKKLELGNQEVIAFLIEEDYIDYLDKNTMDFLENSELNGNYIRNALKIRDFLFRYNMIVNTKDLWNGLPDLFVDELEIEVGFVKLMGLLPDDEGGLMFRLLLDLNSDELIEKLNNLTNNDLLIILRRILKNLKKRQEHGEIETKEFVINKHLTIKLIENKTIIHIDGQPFIQCKFLLMNILEDKFENYDDISSIDEAAEFLDASLERITPPNYMIFPEEEFWGHCSNIQAWAENNYDTRLLHSNIAFPLLKKLTKAGDSIAKRVFKEEIVKRFLEGFPSVVIGLTNQDYLSFLNEEELDTLLESTEDIFVKSQIAVYLLRERETERERFY